MVDDADGPARLVDATVAIDADELAAMAGSATVVLTGPLSSSVALAEGVRDLGSSVVVEVDVVRGGPLDPAPFDDLAGMGLAAGVHLVGEADLSDHVATGWELGAVTWLLTHRVRTVRGVEPRRLRRLVAVAEALAAASDDRVGSAEP